MHRQIRQGQGSMRARLALAVLAALVLGGCAAIRIDLETPEVSFVSLRAAEASFFEQHLAVRTKVRNPNDAEQPVAGPDAAVGLADDPVARRVPVREVVVAANGQLEFDTQVAGNAATALVKVAGGDRNSGDIGDRLKGKLSPRIGLQRTVPFEE